MKRHLMGAWLVIAERLRAARHDERGDVTEKSVTSALGFVLALALMAAIGVAIAKYEGLF